MSHQEVELTQRQQDPAVIFKDQVRRTENEFRAALPAHIPVERFKRVVMTAVVNNPSLLDADRRSLFDSAMKAAQDGLLPDGREGALVIFNAKQNGGWIKKVQWMPMIAGILKKAFVYHATGPYWAAAYGYNKMWEVKYERNYKDFLQLIDNVQIDEVPSAQYAQAMVIKAEHPYVAALVNLSSDGLVAKPLYVG